MLLGMCVVMRLAQVRTVCPRLVKSTDLGLVGTGLKHLVRRQLPLK